MLLKSVFVFVTLFAFSLASDVLEIGDDDFNTKVSETETTLVMFYAPWYVSNCSGDKNRVYHTVLYVQCRPQPFFPLLIIIVSMWPF